MEETLRKIIDISRDFITVINRDYVYEFANEAYCRQFGRTSAEIEGKSVVEIWGQERFQTKIKKKLDACLAGNEVIDIDRFQFGDGFKYIQVSYTPYQGHGRVTHAMVYSRDLTTMKELESKVVDLEFKDPATGLFNQRSFDIVLEMELEKARISATDRRRVLLFVQLRNLSKVSAQYGPQLADLLLESTGNRIKEALKPGDFVFRLEGNRLAVILTSIERSSNIETVADTIVGAVTLPYQAESHSIQISCHIGFAIFPDNTLDRETLVRYAQSAVNAAGEAKVPILAFNPELHAQTLRKERIKGDIRKALVEDQFEPYFQPIVDLEGNLIGAEALIRWNHPQLGWISPSEFIPLAEEAGDGPMIDRWMLFRVCKAIENWGKKLGGCYISINLCAMEFARDSLVEELGQVLRGHVLPPHSLKLEITETQAMNNLAAMTDKIERLAALGFALLIDDFGSGYSSLAYLKRLPVRTIKIDKAFVDTLVDHQEDQMFLTGMITMIASRNREIIVEGVESKAQFDILKRLGVDRFQGYFFSQPVPLDQFERILSRPQLMP